MNHCILMAEIVQAPQLRYTADSQTAVAECVVQFPGPRPEDPSAQLKVIGWGNLGQDMPTRFNVGDRVIVEGRLSIQSIDRPDGSKDKQLELTAQKIHSLSAMQTLDLAAMATGGANPGAASATTSAPPATSAAAPAAKRATPKAAAAAPEPDYDDIPF
jgi:single-strand DNA-binding protein